MLTLYYTYNGTDYQIAPFIDGYRSVNGELATSVAIGRTVIPSAGRYRITPDRTSLDTYLSAIETCELTYSRWGVSFAPCIASARTNNPVTFEVTRPYSYDLPYDLSSNEITFSSDTHDYASVPGLDLDINEGVLYYYITDVIIGGFYISDEYRFVDVLNFGVVARGVIGETKTLIVQNTSGLTKTFQCIVLNKATLLTGCDVPMYAFYQDGLYNPPCDETYASHTITFDNYVAIGPYTPATADILVDGFPIDVVDVVTDTVMSNGVGLACDSTTVYSFREESVYRGITFILSENLQESDTATFQITPGASTWKIKKSTDTSWVIGDNALTIGELDDDEEMSLHICCIPSYSIDYTYEVSEGILQFMDENENIFSVGLCCALEKSGEGDLIEDDTGESGASLFIRTFFLSTATKNKLAEFGITLAS